MKLTSFSKLQNTGPLGRHEINVLHLVIALMFIWPFPSLGVETSHNNSAPSARQTHKSKFLASGQGAILRYCLGWSNSAGFQVSGRITFNITVFRYEYNYTTAPGQIVVPFKNPEHIVALDSQSRLIIWFLSLLWE
jgi:hypothetical protein